MEKIINQAITAHQEGRFEEAEYLYREILKVEPKSNLIHYNLGFLLQKLGRLEEAEVSYRQAITLKPDYFEAHLNLGKMLKGLGRLEEAEVSYRQAITLKPDYFEAHLNLGNMLKGLGRLEEAELSYRQAITSKPDYAEAHNNLGITLKMLGRLEEAEVSYRQAITSKPRLAEIHNNLGLTLHELGRLEEAEVSYRQAITLKPGFVEAHLNMGKNFKKIGKINEAAKYFEQALKINPDDHLGSALELASIGKKNIPNKTPQNYMQNFYHTRSKTWGYVNATKYYGHKLIENAFRQAHIDSNKIDILDLGCGNGILASFLRPYARKLVGVDLSQDMIVEADNTRLYDSLHNEELDRYLDKTSEYYNTVIAAAVMIHFYDLENTFALIKNRLKVNGKFIFSIFEGKEKDKELNSFHMYSHSDNYVSTLADRLKFKINYKQKGIHEYNKEIPIDALIYVFQN
jgi:predicted TPR repeat methyltransferase